MTDLFSLDSYDYDLPTELIAQLPSDCPENARLLICDLSTENLKLEDSRFGNLTEALGADKAIFFNNSKVIRSRLDISSAQIISDQGKHISMNRGEIFFLKQIDIHSFEALVYPGKKLQAGTKIIFDNITFEIVSNTKEGRLIKADRPNFLDFFEKFGKLPLPPYIEYDQSKESSYQPFFANNPGSVASPTACLHFSPSMLDSFKKKGIDINYVSLHIGLGTFRQVNTQDITQFDIHTEQVEISLYMFDYIAQTKTHKKILAIGTTTTRTLESLPYLYKLYNDKLSLSNDTKVFWDKITNEINISQAQDFIKNFVITGDKIIFETKIFIFPGFKFRVIDELITNFHLPKSSLLMMISALMGYDNMKKTYAHAISNGYRFFSFGDGMRIKF